MAASGQLVVVLSLCLLATAVYSQENSSPENASTPPPIGNGICTHYTQGGTLLLDMPKVFDMVLIEFGREIQTLNPMQVEKWMNEVDEDHDRRLNMAECTKLIENFMRTVKRP
ncbi:uncharacterized protein si:dkey-247k7.2 [Xyrauchen texanus]|uniref:uncharacterized protein si:dkey-247k7.2 n=1 Tax=Xyrauchen texanus TaxID=154827 RepID=UPI0022428D19|nr:uncharacterized protein si:dkey-247k7.2 [Xyrauchen texanus]XP_052000485.1 uncharacterized protein si:dkey-247k7.2 [Xyrauchen texanus]XP_052000486.1 uncharacterized protein si:dkey-247k7.2 [Xyrauchen texanus]